MGQTYRMGRRQVYRMRRAELDRFVGELTDRIKNLRL
jgi:hypothetical protein